MVVDPHLVSYRPMTAWEYDDLGGAAAVGMGGGNPQQWSTHEDSVEGSAPGPGGGCPGSRGHPMAKPPPGGYSNPEQGLRPGGGVMASESTLRRGFTDLDDPTGQQHQHHQNRRNRSNNNNNNGNVGTGSQNNHTHGNNASNGHWRGGSGGTSNGRGPMTPGHHDGSANQKQASFTPRRGNMVWINPSIQYNGSGGSRSDREYRADRPNAIPIVEPRSRRVVAMRHGHGVAYGAPAGGVKGGAGAPCSSMTAIAMLEAFARASGLPDAEFQLMESKTNKKAAVAEFLCTVEVDGTKYKSYPDYRPTAELAKETAAAKALAALGITKENLQQRVAEKQATLPVADMSTAAQAEAVAVKLAQMLEKRPNGVFCNSVPQLFAEDFKQKLPDDWQTKVSDHKLLDFVPNAIAKCDVLYRRESEGVDPALASAAPQVPPLSITDEQFMFVTTLIVDVNNFYGRVEREEYHSLVSDMEAYYKVESNLAQQKLEPTDRPVVGALYAVFDESWHRVQCMADESGGELAEFRYVDLGITESISRQKLIHLAYDFYTVPFFAVQLRLEEFEEPNVSESKRPSVHALMDRLMQNKILWAVPGPGVDLASRPLSVKVYDTGDESMDSIGSSEGVKDSPSCQQIDINTEVYKMVATPVIFPAPVIAKGYLSCVLPDGFIFLQIEDFGLSELRNLTVEPVSDKPVESVQENKVYCAQLEGSWYRCVATNIVSDQEIDIEFIDYGNRDTVDISKVFALKTGSHIEDLPPQAVKAHMTNLQPTDVWSPEELAKITDFCPEDQVLIVKVSSSARCDGRDCDPSIQHVDIFKRTQPNDELVSVNHKLSEALRQLATATSAASNGHEGAKGTRLAIGTYPALKPVYDKDQPPTIGSTIMLHVVSAASPLALIVQPFNTSGELAKLRAEMQLYYGKQVDRRGEQITTHSVTGRRELLSHYHTNTVHSVDTNREKKNVRESGETETTRSYFSRGLFLGPLTNLACKTLPGIVSLAKDEDGKNVNTLLRMWLFEEISSGENRLDVSEFEIGAGEFFACLQDEIWERAYVEKASGAPSPDGATCTMVVCYFVDNGAYMPLTVAATSIQPLHQQFRQLARQAIQAGLHGVKPREGAADFDPMDCITFQKHITGRDLEGKICGHSEDSRVSPSPTFSLALELFEEDLALCELYTEMNLLTVVKKGTTPAAGSETA
ncbi:tudor domain-containing protein 7B-like [Tropilaelaps mercedesae]|uniref:Tudor domain-containing protein 7B-like n=1 Tax=Tropilaelaps mercedesae TaxID=418985 RepID=A0A1V9XMA5_9ACAR|nr:tudor domain-containing protein 7B-like [Tropilaelaps mercedesae]